MEASALVKRHKMLISVMYSDPDSFRGMLVYCSQVSESTLLFFFHLKLYTVCNAFMFGLGMSFCTLTYV